MLKAAHRCDSNLNDDAVFSSVDLPEMELLFVVVDEEFRDVDTSALM